MKKIFIAIITLSLSLPVFSQDCSVEMQSLKGTYSGECKKGKANGKGKAVGVDTYEGQFKTGLPYGEGIYIWSSGNRYNGGFSEGQRNGFGTMLYKRTNATDSIVEGFWKNDLYVGKDENPYRVIFKSKLVAECEASYKEDKFYKIAFEITNSTSGAVNIVSEANPDRDSKEREAPKFKIEDLELIRGSYGRLFHNDNHAKKMESILEDVTFPLRLKARIGEESIEMEFRKPGSYKVSVRITD